MNITTLFNQRYEKPSAPGSPDSSCCKISKVQKKYYSKVSESWLGKVAPRLLLCIFASLVANVYADLPRNRLWMVDGSGMPRLKTLAEHVPPECAKSIEKNTKPGITCRLTETLSCNVARVETIPNGNLHAYIEHKYHDTCRPDEIQTDWVRIIGLQTYWDDEGNPSAGPQKCPSATTNRPINIATGNKFYIERDYVGVGPFPLELIRYYNSKASNNWTNNYGQYLTGYGDYIAAHRPDGKIIKFIKSGALWVPEPGAIGVSETFREVVDGNIFYELELPNGTVERYDADGRLLVLRNISGNEQQLSYDGSTVTVTHESGRQLQLVYDSEPTTYTGFGKLVQMIDPASGVFEYVYEYRLGPHYTDDLVKVIFPTSPGSPEEFKEYHYEDERFPDAFTKITDSNNKVVSRVEYDSNHRATLSEGANGADRSTVVYDTERATVTNALGKQTTYHFSNVNGVIRVDSVEGHQTANCAAANRSYGYDANGFVDSKTDWEGNTTTYINNPRGLETSRTEADGTTDARTIITQWHTDYNVPTVIDESGKKTTLVYYPGTANLHTHTIKDLTTSEERVTTYTYENNKVKTIDGPRTDVSDITTFTYHPTTGNLTEITNALNHKIQITEHNPAGRPKTILDHNNVTTSIVYDPRGRIKTLTTAGDTTIYTWDSVGLLTDIELPNGETMHYEYDDARRLEWVEDALGNRITYTPDDAGNPTEVRVKNPSDTVKYTHDNQFDELSRLIHDFGSMGQTSDYEYDKNSNLERHKKAGRSSIWYAHDALNRLEKITYYLNDASPIEINIASTTLDQLDSVTDQRNNVTDYSTNALGDVTTIDSPDSGITEYTPDKAGNITNITDARNIAIIIDYDALNRVKTVTYPDPAYNVTNTYDHAASNGIGRLRSMADPAGTTTYSYDEHGSVSQKDWQSGGVTAGIGYEYDDSGNIEKITYPSGRYVTYIRNDAGQVSSITTTKNDSTQTLASNISYLPFGPMQGMDYGNGLTYTAEYDFDYQIDTLTVSNNILNRDYTPYDSGDIDTIVDLLDVNRDQSFTYDDMGHLETADGIYDYRIFGIDEANNRSAFSVTGASAAPIDVTPINWGVAARDGAFGSGYIMYSEESVHTRFVANPPNVNNSDHFIAVKYKDAEQNWKYDNNAGIFEFTPRPSDVLIAIVNFENDTIIRTQGYFDILHGITLGYESSDLTFAANVWNSQSNPAAVGEFTIGGTYFIPNSGVQNSYSIAVNSNRLDSISGTDAISFGYDANGNTTSKGNFTYTYGDNNRLVEVKLSSTVIATYSYNGRGERVKKVASGVTTYFHYDEQGRLLVEIDDTGNTIREYVYLNGAPLAAIDGTAIYTIHNDHLGTPQVLTDSAKNIVWKADYAPFGNVDITTQAITFNLRFPGQYYDSETGLHYNLMRYYDPATGRYITSDPIGLDAGLNTYLYANANPIRYFDPNGQSAITWGTFGGAGEGAAAGAGSRIPGLLGPIGVVIGGMWPATMGDGTLDNGVDAGSETGSEQCKDDDECQEILRKINQVMKELFRRYMHQCRNKKNQWESHVPAFDGKKRQLAKLVARAESIGCPVPPKAYQWLSTSCPAPGTRTPSPGY